MKLRCTDDLVEPISISWKKSQIVVADTFGRIAFFNLNSSESRCVQSNIPKVKTVLYEENGNGLFIHSSEGKLGYYYKTIFICPFVVLKFAPTGKGFVLLETEDYAIKIVDLENWSILINKKNNEFLFSMFSFQEIIKKLKSNIMKSNKSDFIDKLKIAKKTSKENGFYFGFSLFSIFLHFFNNSKLPLNLAYYGNKDQIINAISFKTELLKNSNSLKNLFLEITLLIMMKEFDKAKLSLLNFRSKNELYPLCAMTAAFLGLEISKPSADLLRSVGLSLIENNDIISGCMLLTVSNFGIKAVELLIQKGFWLEAFIMLKMCDDEIEYVSKSKKEFVSHLDHEGKIDKEILLLASSGDVNNVMKLLEKKKLEEMNEVIKMIFDGEERLEEKNG